MFKEILTIVPHLNYTEESILNYSNTYEIRVNIYENFSILFTFESFKSHLSYQYKQLICISGLHFLKFTYDLGISYELLSFTYNQRLRSKSYLTSISEAPSITKIYKCSGWWERETWELYGIFFGFHKNHRRLLTDYGFEGWPMRKLFPSYGFTELEYNSNERRLKFKAVSFSQEARIFFHEAPWK